MKLSELDLRCPECLSEEVGPVAPPDAEHRCGNCGLTFPTASAMVRVGDLELEPEEANE